MNSDANNGHIQRAPYRHPNTGNIQPQQQQQNQQQLWHPQQHYYADYSQQYGQPYAPNCGYPSTNCSPTTYSRPSMESFDQQQHQQNQQLWQQQQHYHHADYSQQAVHGQLYYAPNGYTGTNLPTTQQHQQQNEPMGVLDAQNCGYVYQAAENMMDCNNVNMEAEFVVIGVKILIFKNTI